jgi:uncharacterized membrane protein YoaK (UPF0700 family)
MHKVESAGTVEPGLKGDVWEVVALVGVIVLVAGVWAGEVFLMWAGVALLSLWILQAALVLVGVIKPRQAKGTDEAA